MNGVFKEFFEKILEDIRSIRITSVYSRCVRRLYPSLVQSRSEHRGRLKKVASFCHFAIFFYRYQTTIQVGSFSVDYSDIHYDMDNMSRSTNALLPRERIKSGQPMMNSQHSLKCFLSH